jgi:hypothetical protein
VEHEPLARYANYFEIRYTANEFLLDFGQHYPGDSPPVCHTRIIVNLDSAAVLLEMLSASLERYRCGMQEGKE